MTARTTQARSNKRKGSEFEGVIRAALNELG